MAMRDTYPTARIATALLVALPGTIAAPFALWLLVASFLQFLHQRWIVSWIVALFSMECLMTLLIVWGYVILGPLDLFSSED